MEHTADLTHSHGPRQVREVADTALTDQEQGRLAVRIGTSLVAAALLIVGWVYAVILPDQKQVADLILFCGSLVAGVPVFIAAARSLVDGKCSSPGHAHEHSCTHAPHGRVVHGHVGIMDQLVAIAVLASIATGEYATAIVVPLLMAIGHFLEERSVLGAHAAIEGLKRLQPTTAARLGSTGTEESVPLDRVAPGDRVVVRPGEVFPTDGRVETGLSAADQSAVSGESVPVDVGPGSPVFAGTLNVSGMLTVRVTETGGQTAMGKVLETLRAAEQSRAPVTQLLERYASYYAPFVLLVASVALILTGEVSRAVAVLVVACPCALVLSSSTAMVAALAVASRYGILIKSARFLEVLCEARRLVLDKTGTVTIGRLDVAGLVPLNGFDEAELLASAAYCAQGSRHPVSQAVLREAQTRALDISPAESITEHPGQGMEARRDGETLRLGNAGWLEVSGDVEQQVGRHTGPVVWAGRNGTLLGAVLLADRPRPEAKEAILALRRLGVERVVLLTGDRSDVAAGIADGLEIDQVHADLQPVDKVSLVEREAAGGAVLFVGDGVNDAPALARADVGVAMGAMGSDAAILSSDIALMNNDLSRVATAMRLSGLTRRVITVNVAIGIASALVMVTLAALGYVGAIVGALLHNVGAVAVVLNSAGLLRVEPDKLVATADVAAGPEA